MLRPLLSPHLFPALCLALAALLAGCAAPEGGAARSTGSAALPADAAGARRLLASGTEQFQAGRLDAAQAELQAALDSQRLSAEERVQAYKTLGFVHCQARREAACAEAFGQALRLQPALELSAQEAANPAWTAVFRNVKQSVAAARPPADAGQRQAQQQLAAGIRAYEGGNYEEALKSFGAAQSGLASVGDQVRAMKYSAFSYCVTQRITACRLEFQNIFRRDPAFDLTPAEAGHPAWSRIFAQERERVRPGSTPAPASPSPAPAPAPSR